MADKQHNFTGLWIPAHIWLDKSLSLQQKALIAEVHALSVNRSCTASDEYLASFMDLSVARIKSVIKQCEVAGFIRRKTIMTQAGRKREMSCTEKFFNPSASIESEPSASIKNNPCASIENNASQVSETIPSKYQKQAIDNKEDNKEENTSSSALPSGGKVSTKKYKFSDEDLAMAEYMFACILRINPDHKKPIFESWANTLRLMREKDNRNPHVMTDVWNWTTNDSFWQTNVLSAEKFRKQFDQLLVKTRRAKDASRPRPDDDLDLDSTQY